jgi:hypothetical protein
MCEYVIMCIYFCGFWVFIRVSGIRLGFGYRGFGFGYEITPESVLGSGSGFDFGFWVWVHEDSTRSEPDPLPSLAAATMDRGIRAHPGAAVGL